MSRWFNACHIFIGWSVNMDHSSKHTVRWSCRMNDTGRKWSSAIFGHKAVTTAVFEALSLYDTGRPITFMSESKNTLLKQQHANSLSLSQWQPISVLRVILGRKSINDDERSEIMMEHCVAWVWRNVSALFYWVIRRLIRALMNNILSILKNEDRQRDSCHGVDISVS